MHIHTLDDLISPGIIGARSILTSSLSFDFTKVKKKKNRNRKNNERSYIFDDSISPRTYYSGAYIALSLARPVRARCIVYCSPRTEIPRSDKRGADLTPTFASRAPALGGDKDETERRRRGRRRVRGRRWGRIRSGNSCEEATSRSARGEALRANAASNSLDILRDKGAHARVTGRAALSF